MNLIELDFWGTVLPTITASTEETGYPAINTQHIHLSKEWHSTGAMNEWVKAQFPIAIGFDCVAIVAHAFSSTAIVTVQANSSDSWATPAFSITLDPTDVIPFSTFATQTYTWWRILISDASAPYGQIRIGRVMLGKAWTSEEPITDGFKVSIEDSTRISESITGQRFSDLGVRRKIYTFSMGTMKNSTKEYLMYLAGAFGRAYPTVVEPAVGIPRLYATLEADPEFTAIGAWGWTDSTIVFKEAL